MTSVKVVAASVPELRRAAREAAKQWRYEPVLSKGVAVPVSFTERVDIRPEELRLTRL